MLVALDELVTWARMKFKAKKSRSLIIRKGKVSNRFVLKVQGEEIPSLVDSPVKCLGKWFDSTLKDTGNIERVKSQLREGLSLIDKSGLPGKFKCWLYQHGLLPRLLWPVMLYEITTSSVEALEMRLIGQYEDGLVYHLALLALVYTGSQINSSSRCPLLLKNSKWLRHDWL